GREPAVELRAVPARDAFTRAFGRSRGRRNGRRRRPDLVVIEVVGPQHRRSESDNEARASQGARDGPHSERSGHQPRQRRAPLAPEIRDMRRDELARAAMNDEAIAADEPDAARREARGARGGDERGRIDDWQRDDDASLALAEEGDVIALRSLVAEI